jgi:L-aminopeptidase/D-esterase-like protein
MVTATYVGEHAMSRFYEATIEAIDEAILNSIFANKTMIGRDGNVSPGLPIAHVQEILRRHNRLLDV